MKDTNVSYLT